MSGVKIVAISQPIGIDGVNTAEEFIAYAARVSNPGNQINSETAPKLLRYLAKHAHWSPFEMVSVTMEIKTTRDIGRQILRHRSFSFQEFSQRYAEVTDQFESREARMQDLKNRQNSTTCNNEEIMSDWQKLQDGVQKLARSAYKEALNMGIAKEQARALLPEGMTKSTMYMSGTLRSWIHYCELRMAHGTQKEHMDIAKEAWRLILEKFPSLSAVLGKEEPKVNLEKKSEYLTKDEAEKMIEKFVSERRYIPQQPFTVYGPGNQQYQPCWLDPYPQKRWDVQFSAVDKDTV